MAVEFEKLQFTKDWNNPTDFPTYEESEQKVRADLQALHDETKEFINETLIPNIEILAVPGTGDMKTEVYDPWNKREDVYQYAEDKVTEAVEEHLAEAHHVDAFSKEESLSAETREALGLAEDAVPDDAFAKIAAKPDVVMEVNTGKKYTVKAKLDGFGLSSCAVLQNIASDVTDLFTASYVALFRRGNYLCVAGTTACAVYDLETGEKVTSLATTTASKGWSSPGFQNLMTDGSCCAVTLEDGSRQVLDFDSLTFKNYDKYARSVLFDGDAAYWIQHTGNSANGTFYAGTKASPTQRNVSYSRNSYTHYAEYDRVLGAANGKVYLLIRVANTGYKLSYYDSSGGNIVDGITTFSGLSGTNSAAISVAYILLNPVLKIENRFYFQVETQPSTGSTKYTCNKLFWIDLETLEHNWSEMRYENLELTADAVAYAANFNYYMGSIGDNAYFLRDSVVAVLHKSNGDLSRYSLVTTETMSAVGHGSCDEVFFEIPDLPGYVISGTYMLDTTKGVVRKIVLTDAKAESVYGIAFGGVVTDTEVLGLVDVALPVGGEPVVSVDRLETYTE